MKKIFSLLVLSVFICSTASASIVLRLGKGIDQGSANRKVNIGKCNVVSEVESTVAVSCYAGGTKTCPTNADIREDCPNATIVPWIPNSTLDNGVVNVLSLWNDGLGTLSGTQNSTVVNSGTGETAIVSFSWVTLPGDIIEITIDVSVTP